MAQRKKIVTDKNNISTASSGTAPKGKAGVKTDGLAAQSAVPASAASGNGGRTPAKSATPKVEMTLNHEQIAKRAFAIWVAKGRPAGQDAQNWHEAEQVLASELARRA